MKRGLGKGLDALFADNALESTEGSSALVLRLSEIEPNRGQPRKKFDEEALSQLADSIRQHGILQPLVVRPVPTGGYQLVAGERRWRAARMAGLSEVPAIIKDLDDTEAMEIALIENLQREDLNAIEEAEGYQTLIDIYGLTQENVAVRVGKSRPAVTNALRLLNLPETVRDMVKNGELSQGHARTLLSLDNPVEMKTIAEDIVKKGLTVRNVEKIVKDKESAPKEKTEKERPKPVGVLVSEVERGLTEYLGRRVTVTEGKNKGIIEIEYYGDEDLKGLIRLIAKD